jgi:predicted PurR-regulated permease PerM
LHNINKKIPWEENEHGFLICLTLLAFSGLIYLFQGFLMPMIFSAILACATYPLFIHIQKRFKLNDTKASLIFVSLIFILIVVPISYILTKVGIEAQYLYSIYPEITEKMNFKVVDDIKPYIVDYTFISETNFNYLVNFISENSESLKENLKDFLLIASKTIINSSLGIVGFFAVTLFSLFFFYRDGKYFSKHIKILSPLNDNYDDILINEIVSLSSILTFSIFVISILQGVAFALLTYFMDLDWLFIGVAIGLCSFIPVVGAAIVWLPLSIYLFGTNHWIQGILVFFWGMVVAGFIIDNIMRPFVISKICKFFEQSPNKGEFAPLEHTFLVILSTIGGVGLFGVLGLIIGPIIAAFSISILGVYILRLKNLKKTQ